LVSVRDAAEAHAALAGGADLIDVKEPANGPLGRAADAVIAEVVRAVAGRVPVSAALGELHVNPDVPPARLDYVKWGLAGWEGRDWRAVLAEAPRHAVVVAYADWRAVAAPHAAEVVAFAAKRRSAAFLIDTAVKDGRTLLNCLPVEIVGLFADWCRENDVPLALAGSLGPDEVARLAHARPTWFAVRGAVCDGGRGGRVCADKVRRLRAALG
jgi:uncharacterized protein (UPF0264 family)